MKIKGGNRLYDLKSKRRIIGRALMLAVGVTFVLASCDDSPPHLSASAITVTIDASPAEEPTVDISANVAWRAKVKETGNWLSLSPSAGSSDATITLVTQENTTVDERNAIIVLVGEGVDSVVIEVSQKPGIDVATMMDDDKFREYCIEEFDTKPKDGKLSIAEVNYVTDLDVKDKGIASLTGIEYFTALEILDCSFNEKMTNIDISKNLALTDLICSNDDLSNLNMSLNTKLARLECGNNQLSNIDVMNNVLLNILWCDNNLLTNIDVSKNPELLYLHCTENKLSTLDVTKNTKLVDLWCSGNLLTTLNLDHNPDLRYFYCVSNKFVTLDISKNTTLGNAGQFDSRGNNLLTTIKVWQSFDITNPPNSFYKPDQAQYVK